MITLKDFMELVDYKISDGSEYLWDCYGAGARTMAYEDIDRRVSINIVFTPNDQDVAELQVWDGPNNREYRWIHPAFIEGHAGEAIERGVDWKQSLDDRNFIDIEEPEDILEKARAVFLDEDYDTRVIVKLTIGRENEILLMEMAHEADLSLNQFVEKILREDILRNHGIEV
jgi:hypothetical protein